MELSKNTQPTDEQVSQWQEQYGRLKKAVVKDAENEEEMAFYFKKIDLKLLRLANQVLTQEKDTVKYAEVILKNTIINGLDCLEDSDVFLALVPIVDKLLTSKVASLEKN